jgi:acetyl-CoA carboxylase biotin carboxylase subunit
VDLVREQLRVAAGEPTSLPGRPLSPRGHAIECRITSEDPANNFLPATGRIEFLRIPSGPGIRWDGGVQAGTEIGLFYDPLLGKLIAWGENRDRAIRRMRRALDEMVIIGVPTSQPFHRAVLDEPEFLSGKYDIGYIERHGQALASAEPEESELESIAIAAVLAADAVRGSAHPDSRDGAAPVADSNWLRSARENGLR